MVAYYVIKDVTRLVSQGYYADAALVLRAQGAPPDAAHAPLYARVAAGVLAAPAPQRNPEAEAALKAALFDVYSVLRVRTLLCLFFGLPLCLAYSGAQSRRSAEADVHLEKRSAPWLQRACLPGSHRVQQVSL